MPLAQPFQLKPVKRGKPSSAELPKTVKSTDASPETEQQADQAEVAPESPTTTNSLPVAEETSSLSAAPAAVTKSKETEPEKTAEKPAEKPAAEQKPAVAPQTANNKVDKPPSNKQEETQQAAAKPPASVPAPAEPKKQVVEPAKEATNAPAAPKPATKPTETPNTPAEPAPAPISNAAPTPKQTPAPAQPVARPAPAPATSTQAQAPVTGPPPIIIDSGSFYVKAGLGTDDQPSRVFVNVVGVPRYQIQLAGTQLDPMYIGNEAMTRLGLLTAKWPVSRGFIGDWQNMGRVWQHAFSRELKVNSSGRSVVLAEAPLNAKQNRLKMTQIMFESFGIENLYIADQATLALSHATPGRAMGLVLDCGSSGIRAVPISKGHVLAQGVQTLFFGGTKLTAFMARLLSKENNSGQSLLSSIELEVARDIKESLGYCALDYAAELQKPAAEVAKEYELPSGHRVKIGAERFTVAEALFDPSICGQPAKPNIAQLIVDAVNASQGDPDLSNAVDLYSNIVITGGSSMFAGIEARLRKEILALAGQSAASMQITAPANRKYGAWLGASSVASKLPADKWISRREYEESGPAIVNRKLPPS